MPEIQIMPSILAADMCRLGEEVRSVEIAGADQLHVDVMDGCFVPNLSMGPGILKAVKGACGLPANVHLMVMWPAPLLDAFIDAGADTLLVQVECRDEVAPMLQHIRSRGIRAGVVLNPETPVAALEPYIDLCDEILFMSVHPGFGGQKFIPEVLTKAKAVRARYPHMDVAIDGGIGPGTAGPSAAAGINLLVAGTAVFGQEDRKTRIQELRDEAASSWCSAVGHEAE